jgi:hypothetical protein
MRQSFTKNNHHSKRGALFASVEEGNNPMHITNVIRATTCSKAASFPNWKRVTYEKNNSSRNVEQTNARAYLEALGVEFHQPTKRENN